MKNLNSKCNLYIYFWSFFIGSILGFIYESILSYFQFGYIINKQELVLGPFMPVYGIGAIIFMYISKKFKSITMIFILTFIFGSLVEFFYSFIQENLFGVISWDYSNSPLNIDGRVALIFSIGWGCLGIISCKFILPYLDKFISLLYTHKTIIITNILIIFMIFNIAITSIALYRQKQRYFNIAQTNFISQAIDNYYNNNKMDNIFENQKKLYKNIESTFSN